MASDDDENEQCCGSGCNNCILDRKNNIIEPLSQSKPNIFNQKYIPFKMATKSQCTSNVIQLNFVYFNDMAKLDLDQYSLWIPPGYHIMLRTNCPDSITQQNKHDKDTDGNYISRPYTPIAFNTKLKTFNILVKIEENGFMSKYLNNCSVGDVIDVKGVCGNFQWTPNSYKYILCICQGVAIAPIYTAIKSILDNDQDDTIVHVLVVFKNIENILLRNEINQFRQYWNFFATIYLADEKLCHCHSQIPNCDCIKSKLKFNETICPFRLDYNQLFNFYNDKDKNAINCLICGSAGFVNAIKSYLKNLNIKDENIFIF